MIQSYEEAYAWLMQALPEADALSADERMLRGFVEHALMLRATCPWCRELPEDIFLAYVLFPRVNDEALAAHRRAIYQELYPALSGLRGYAQVLEVNLWCLQKATYRSTDARTLSALGVMRRAFGRCGEESVLLTCALRAVGIPARQCYAPRWSHCDDNHAWVEAYWDGAWHYTGACEPEPRADEGWFTAAASRAMLVHTRAFGLRALGGEEILASTAHFLHINRLNAYAKTCRVCVAVTADGAPLAGARVRFEVFNMGELYPLATLRTDAAGKASLTTGLGTLHIHVTDGVRYGVAVAHVPAQSEVAVALACGPHTAPADYAYDQRAPEETRMAVASRSAAFAERLARANEARAAYEATLRRDGVYWEKARGNHEQIARFLTCAEFKPEDKRALLDTLTEKDFCDCTAEVFCDALRCALPHREKFPPDIWAQDVLAPRVGNETLYPIRCALRCEALRALGNPCGAEAVQRFLEARVRITDAPAEELFGVANGLLALRAGRTDAVSYDTLLVNLCRALGIPARLDAATGQPLAYARGAYRAMRKAQEADAVLRLRAARGGTVEYGVQCTLGRLEGGVYRTLRLPGDCAGGSPIAVRSGDYRLLTGARQIDGTVRVRAEHFFVGAGEQRDVYIAPAEQTIRERLRVAALPDIQVTTLSGRALPLRQGLFGGPGILAFLSPGEEPSEHLLLEICALSHALAHVGLCFVLTRAEQQAIPSLQKTLRLLPQARVFVQAEPPEAVHAAFKVGDRRLPLSVAVGQRGLGLFAFANYNVGTAQLLLEILREDPT